MAKYSNLLLSEGGGIFAAGQRSKQNKDYATVFIGIGGTGIDAIRAIKTKIYEHIEPDSEIGCNPEYSHIAFLGIDSVLDSKDKNGSQNPHLMPLSESEMLLIGESGTMGRRDFGHQMMMNSANAFMEKFIRAVNQVRMGLDSPNVCINIYSGLCGGTSGGCLLDVCYMVRAFVQSVTSVLVSGYFFLPDVNLNKIQFGDYLIRESLEKNAYETMKELDSFMNLKYSSNEQLIREIKGIDNKKWTCPPVDMCYLISGTDASGNTYENPYYKAINSAADFSVKWLIENDDSDNQYIAHMCNCQAIICEARAERDDNDETFCVGYCSVGTSCAIFPYRLINTYLATGLFNKFSAELEKEPQSIDIEYLARRTFLIGTKDISELYNTFVAEIAPADIFKYEDYKGTWKQIREYGNADLVRLYTNQTAVKKNLIESNTNCLISADNERSFLNRINHALIDICKDSKRGPIVAYKLLDPSQTYNMIRIIDDLISQNNAHWDREIAQKDLKERFAETSWKDFEVECNKKFINKASNALDTFEKFLLELEEHRLEMFKYEQIDLLLNNLKKALLELASSYYAKLAKCLTDLFETFKANDADFAEAVKQYEKDNEFDVHIARFDEVKPILDKLISNINVETLLAEFVADFVKDSKKWINKGNSNFVKFVNSFVTEKAFEKFDIDAYLKIKYPNMDSDKIDDAVYKDYLAPLVKNSATLFKYNTSIRVDNWMKHINFISVPAKVNTFVSAENKCNSLHLTDYVDLTSESDICIAVNTVAGLPICAYEDYIDWENKYSNEKQ